SEFIGPHDFPSKKLKWAEQLEVRLGYAMQKLEENKITFGSGDNSYKSRSRLVEVMSRASSELAFLPRYEGDRVNENKEFMNQYGKTRRGQLEKVLKNAEDTIDKNRNAFIKDKRDRGALYGVLFAGAGYETGH